MRLTNSTETKVCLWFFFGYSFADVEIASERHITASTHTNITFMSMMTVVIMRIMVMGGDEDKGVSDSGSQGDHNE